MQIEAIPAWVTATNAYLVIGDRGQALLVDAPPDPDAIGRHIAERGVAVTAVLLTHGHIDHTGGAGKLTANAGAVAYVHPEDDFLTFHPTDQLKRIFGYVPPGSYELPERIERLEHGQMLTLAGITLEVRHTPGHTPGHCCFYSERGGGPVQRRPAVCGFDRAHRPPRRLLSPAHGFDERAGHDPR
jgi:hydroxyacylglutathione hydrolase